MLLPLVYMCVQQKQQQQQHFQFQRTIIHYQAHAHCVKITMLFLASISSLYFPVVYVTRNIYEPKMNRIKMKLFNDMMDSVECPWKFNSKHTNTTTQAYTCDSL